MDIADEQTATLLAVRLTIGTAGIPAGAHVLVDPDDPEIAEYLAPANGAAPLLVPLPPELQPESV